MKKIAFFTMDTESFYDTTCIQEKICNSGKNIYQKNSKFSCAEEVYNFSNLAKRYEIPITYFLNVDFLPLCKDFIETQNNEIALHCYKHVSPLTQTLSEFENDLTLAKKSLVENFGKTPKGFRAPCFGINDDVLQILQNHKFLYDSSLLQTNLSIYNGKINLKNYQKLNSSVYKKDDFFEFLPSTVNFLWIKYPISGGAYLRIPPFIFVKYLLKKYLKSANSYVFYVHPFEICKKNLPLPKNLRFFEKIFVNCGRKTYFKRIEKIIKILKKNGFCFSTPNQFIQELSLDSATNSHLFL